MRTRGNRESGGNPERSRHCNRGVFFHACHSIVIGEDERTQRSGKPGDLPRLLHRKILRGEERCTEWIRLAIFPLVISFESLYTLPHLPQMGLFRLYEKKFATWETLKNEGCFHGKHLAEGIWLVI